ncbi:alpha/beta hydrolase [Providencia alcalifaciens]|uniref:alpha/beta hydrolase n=1 Tax=Providencia alcalifaciens TaxID=126385 RepID=UPI00044DC1E4|nr:alpha/beta hydrolase-fold protein [Providencia alcalifaciens]EUD07374.1 putative esterase [Providencia alcalifaciens R90-1475]
MMQTADYPPILFRSVAIPMIKKLFMASLLMCIANNTWARPSPNIPEFDARVAEVYTVQHHDMRNGQRELRIYSAVPKDVSGKRPVLFMLDGNGLYPLAVNQAAQQFARDKLPIIIGIGYPNPEAFPKKERTYDYTPKVAGEAFQDGGGAESLYQFLTFTVRPWAEQQFPIDTQRETLFGHSFGGLFTLMVYQNHPTDFQHFVSASPSLWWGEGEMVDLDKLTRSSTASPIAITLGELEETPDLSRLTDEQKQNYQTRKSWISPREVCEAISSHQRSCEFTLFAGKTHGSVIPDAIHKALDLTVAQP